MSKTWLAVSVVTVLIGMGQFLLAGQTVPPVQVPEPASLLLLASGVAGVGFWRWRRSKDPKE